MNDAQAIPDNLFYYSDQTKNANADLRHWIARVLAPAVRGYQQTAIDFGGGIDGLTAGTGIDVEAQHALAQVSAVDEQVRPVGQAFLDAGNKGEGSVTLLACTGTPLDPGTGDPNRYAIITTSDNAVAAEEGTQLAQYYFGHGLDKTVLQQLRAHEDDPSYLAAFYNGLPPDNLRALLGRADGTGGSELSGADRQLIATTLAHAYAASTLSADIKGTLMEWLLSPFSHADFYREFMTALANNKEAALSFTGSLTDMQFDQLAHGAGGGPVLDQAQSQVLFINMCTAALSAMSDPGQAKSLMDKLISVLTSTQPVEMDAVIGALVPLMANFYSVYFKVPPLYTGPDKGDDLELWIQHHDVQYAAEIAGELSRWIYTTVGANETAQVFLRQLVEATAVAGLLIFPPVGAVADGAALGVKVTLAMFEAAASGWGVAYLDGKVFDSPPDPRDKELSFNYSQAAYAQMLVVSQLLAEDQLTYADPHVPSDQVLNWIMNHPDKVHIAGTDKSVYDIMNLVSAQYYQHQK